MMSVKDKAMDPDVAVDIRKMAATLALNQLSAWAADFKMGVIGDKRVVSIMRAIVNGLEGFSDEEREVALEEALDSWDINYQLYLTQEDNDDDE